MFVLETDFRAYWLWAKAVVGYMDEGVILNMSSNHALLKMPSHFPYNALRVGITPV